MAGASIKVTGLGAAQRKVQKTEKAATKSVPDLVGTLVVAGVKSTFFKGEDPDTGTAWAPIKNRKGQPLRDTGRLMRSIHYEKRGTSVSIGTNLIYALTHQKGDPNRVPRFAKYLVFEVMGVTVRAKKVSIPQRRFLPETDEGLNRATDGMLQPSIDKFLSMQWA